KTDIPIPPDPSIKEKLMSDTVMRERIEGWIALFNQLPGVWADIEDKKEEEGLITVYVKGSTKSFIENGRLELGIVLTPNGGCKYYFAFNHPSKQSHDGDEARKELSDICLAWEKEVLSIPESTWEKIYDKVVELIKRYEASVPAVVEK